MQESDFAGVTQSLETGTRVGRILRLIRVVRVVKVISLLGKRNKDKVTTTSHCTTSHCPTSRCPTSSRSRCS